MPVYENEYVGKSIQRPARFEAGNHFARAVAGARGIADPANARVEPITGYAAQPKGIWLAPRSVALPNSRSERKNGRARLRRAGDSVRLNQLLALTCRSACGSAFALRLKHASRKAESPYASQS